MHSSVSAQHASPCKSMRDDVSSVSQLFDMQKAFLCKCVSTALDTAEEWLYGPGVVRDRKSERKQKSPRRLANRFGRLGMFALTLVSFSSFHSP